MENAELEVALEELESRLERLRALYEQYFMGIERIEPAIPRKDIDRRIYVLRREKIRNTAKRFKLQTIISRYNTFQQYWQRICREIELGTYKRHVIKAERIAPGKMMTIAARKRLGRVDREAMAEGASEATPPSSIPPAAPSVAPRPAPAAMTSTANAPGAPPLVPPAKPVPPPKPGARPPKPISSLPPPAVPPASAKPSVAPPAPRAAFENLDLDMDFLGDWDPSSAASKPAAKRVPQVPARPFGKPLSRPMNTPPAPPVASNTPVASNNGLPAPPPLGPARQGAAPLRAAPPPRPAAPKASAPSAAAVPPPVPARPAPPPAPSAIAARPVPPPSAAMGAPPAPPPAAAKSLAAPIPGASPPKPSPAKPATPAVSAAAPHDDRVRELHARFVEAKRQTQDASTVSMEGLAKSMKATEAKLREQHKNRKIDFDVVIKDGKAVLKPIVR